jgi:hypothetical protein
MKLFLLAIIVEFSSTTFAKSPASSALLDVISSGKYLGINDKNEECIVSVRGTDNEVEVTVEDRYEIASYITNSNEDYAQGRVGRQNVLFLQLDIVNGGEKNSIRIVNSNINKLNVSVGNFVSWGREHRYKTVSCNI